MWNSLDDLTKTFSCIFGHLLRLSILHKHSRLHGNKGELRPNGRQWGMLSRYQNIIDLNTFLESYPHTLQELGSQTAPNGFRPQSAAVDVPAESALSLIGLDRSAGLTRQKVSGAEFRYSITGVDYLHFLPGKNGPRMLSAGRVELRKNLAEDYGLIAGLPGQKPRFSNPLFRRALLQHLLDDLPWFRPFSKLFQEWPAEFFVSSDKSPKKITWFWVDARKKLQEVYYRMADNPEPDEDDVLATKIKSMVGCYLDAKLKKDAGYDFKQYRESKKTPPDAAEARRNWPSASSSNCDPVAIKRSWITSPIRFSRSVSTSGTNRFRECLIALPRH